MATSADQEASSRAKRAPVPSKKLTDTSNTATPELSAHSEAIALKRAEDAKRLAEKQRQQGSLSVTAETPHSVSPAKRARTESEGELSNQSSNAGDDSDGSAVPKKPKSKQHIS